MNDAASIWEELKHRDSEGKVAWLKSLAANPTDESIQTLRRALAVESWFVRDQAARLLGTLGERVVDTLVQDLDSGLWYTRSAAALALGRTGSPSAAAPLVGGVLDANRTVRDSSWEAIVRLCATHEGCAAVAAAIQALQPRPQRFALEGLAARDARVAESVHSLLREPARLSLAGYERLDRAVNEDASLHWEDVVGGDGTDSPRG